MLKVVGWFLLMELIQFLAVVVVFELTWRYVLKPNLPKVWVNNLTMIGFS